MKKCLSLFLALILLLSSFAGCAFDQKPEDEGFHIVCTVFPIYDWVKELTHDVPDLHVSLLLDNGEEMHGYQPSSHDIMDISTCDMLIMVGGESDAWIDEALAQAQNQETTVIKLMNIPNMTLHRDTIHEHEEANHAPYDEHVWLSLQNALTACSYLANSLAAYDPAHRTVYEKNLNGYTKNLKVLDRQYTTLAAQAPAGLLVFCDRFPFRYLTADYGFSYIAASVGCSTDTEVDFDTVITLASAVSDHALPVVLVLDGGNTKLAKQVITESKQEHVKILTVHSMQSISKKNMDAGTSYLSLMEKNLSVLQKALKKENADASH